MIDTKEVRRDYSLSSSPQSESLTVTVKEIEGGVFSSHANTQLKTGDTLEVGTPNGRFVYEPENRQGKYSCSLCCRKWNYSDNEYC